MSKIWWIGWHQPTTDCRPMTFPPNDAILGWWCTGEAADGSFTLVADVAADDETQAKEVVIRDWPEACRWRFCGHSPQRGSKPGGRFPVEDWMIPRYEAAEAAKETT